ncbi:membrane-bound transcription factor site-2 protease [Neodiprion fabricii]|uniref:membrane-bound transcription factor site-2 protease n=1 Tax=Neodiprion fabricii TaxID=2872261 RepID=UPI001ED9752A|nr:membrane-bound transcription factor site-2 protease [Neodiprion fabricii]
MDSLNILIGIGLVHCTLFFFDTFFRSCSHYPYLYFLKNTGITIEALRIRWYTTACNRMIMKWATDRSKFWLAWFNAGVIITILLLPVASFIILKMTFNLWTGQTAKDNSVQTLEPMLPGVNLPLDEIGYYAATLALCSVVHEFGHALAAAREDVQVFGMGLLVALVIPVAYAHISSEQLGVLPVYNQLRILCAGVWHNIVLATLAAGTLILTTWLWAPLYTVGHGVAVKTITSNSPLLGSTGLLPRDTIYRINDCTVNDCDDWYHCILTAVRQPSPGYCVTQKLIQEYDESVPAWHMANGAVSCCGEDSEAAGSLCFEYIEGPPAAPLQLPPHSCLPARLVTSHAQRFCQYSHHCTPHETHCMQPSLDNVTKVVQIKRREGNDVLFIGDPGDIYRTVDVSDWVPKYSFLNSELPEALALLCKYVTVFSAGLAVVNVVPCFCFDGQYIVAALFMLRSRIRQKSLRQALALMVTCIGTLFLSINLVYIFVNKII